MRTVVLAFALVASAVAGPLSRYRECARHCVESSKFQYQPGTVYSYRYQARSVTTLQGSLQDESILHMTALVDVEVISKCNMALQLREVDLDGSDDIEFKNALQRHVLEFAFQDGQINEICSENKDPSWVLNIKRGILSALQNSMTNLESPELVSEIDVNGRCEAQYTALGSNWGGTITVRRNKNLTLCHDRSFSQSAFQANPDSSLMYQNLRSIPLVSGMQSCEQSFKSGILQKTSCSEMHIFKPFAKHKSSVITKSSQTLVFSGESRKTFSGSEYRIYKSDMLFDHAYSYAATPLDQVEAESILSKLCAASLVDIRPETPEIFTQFIYKLRHLNHGALRSLLSRTSSMCSDVSSAKRFFLDALPMVSTPGSVRMMVELITKNEVSRKEAEFWMAAVAFYKDPSADMISTLTALVEGEDPWALLGVSSLGHTFCKSQRDCRTVPEVRQLVTSLMSHIGRGCHGVETRRALLALKALGNLGIYPDEYTYLKNCFENPQNEMEVRVSAIQAFRKFSCQQSRKDLLTMYKNVNEEVELRISAFVASAACPSRETVQAVHDTLKSEPINQVGSFVWSYLTSRPHPLFRDILVDRTLSKMFGNADALKFSRAFSGEAFFDSLDVGTRADGQVVFSPDSYLPRSGLFNLTLDILGTSVNILEVGGRIEGFERMVEGIFGPNGYLPQDNIHEMLGSLRGKRSPSKIKEFEQAFEPSRLEKEPLASIYMKIFGNELWYTRLGQNSGSSLSLQDILRSLAQEKETEISKSMLFLDSIHTIPMGSGFPLKVALNGSASVSLKLGGKFEFRNLDNVDVKARIQPSGAVTISSLITVEAGKSARTGLKVRATAHSSTVLDGLVEIRNGRTAKARINLPRDRLEIFDVRSEFYLIRNQDVVQSSHRPEPVENVKSCSREILGLRLCAAVSTPRSPSPTSPLYPFSGPAVAQVILEKTEPNLTSYMLDVVLLNNEAFIVMNTHGSPVKREVNLQAQWNIGEEKSIKLKMQTPEKNVELDAKMVNSEGLKRLRLGLLINDEEYAIFDSELALKKTAQEFLFAPLLQIRGPNGRLLALTGSGVQVRKSFCAVELTLEDLTTVPIVIRGKIENMNERYQGQISMASSALESELKGYVQVSRETIASKMTLNYQRNHQRKHSIDTNFKIRNLSASSLTKYNVMGSLTSTQYPELSSSASWEMQSTHGHLENTLQLSLGDARRGRVRKITLQEIVRYQTVGPKTSAALTLKFVYPERYYDYSIDVKHEHTERSVSNRVNLQYAPGKVISTIVDLIMDTSNKVHLKGDIQVKTPNDEMKLLANLNEEVPKEYQLLTSVQWQRGKQIRASATFKDSSVMDNYKYRVDGEVMLSKKNPIIFSADSSLSKESASLNVDMDIKGSKYKLITEYNRPSTSNHQVIAQFDHPQKSHHLNVTLNLDPNNIYSRFDLKLDGLRRIISQLKMSKIPGEKKSLAYEIVWDADVDMKKMIAIHIDADPFSDPSPVYKIVVDYPERGFMTVYKCTLFKNGAEQTLNINWDRKEIITSKHSHIIDFSKPEKVINFDFWVNTQYNNYKRQRLYFTYNSNQNVWTSTLEVLFGKSIAVTTTGKKERYPHRRLMSGSIDVNTTFSGYESLYMAIHHEKDFQRSNNKMEMSWGPNKKISTGLTTISIPNGFRTNLEYTGPFERIQQLDASISHAGSNGEFSTDSQIRWNNNGPIEMKVEGKMPATDSLMLSMQASSPYRGFEKLAAKAAYKYDSNSFDTNLELNKNEDKINMGAEGKFTQRKQVVLVEGKGYATTPMRGYENMLIKIKHHSDADNFKTSLDAQTHPRGVYSFRSQGKIPSMNNFEVILNIETPVDGYKKIASKLSNKINPNNMQSVFEMTSDNKKYLALLTSTHSSSRKSGKLEGNLEINTPIQGMEHLKVSLDYSRQNNEKYITKITGMKGNQLYTLSHDILYKPWNIIESTIIIKPYPGYSEIRSFQNIRMNSGMMTYTSSMEGDGRTLHTVNMDYQNNMQGNGKDIRGSLKIDYPQIKKSLDISGYLKNDPKDYKAVISFNNMNDRTLSKMNYEGTLNYRTPKSMSGKMSLTSNYPGYEGFNLEGNLDATSPEIKSEMSLQWGRQGKKITFQGQASGSMNNGESKIILRTPYKVFENFEFLSNIDLTSTKKNGNLKIKLDSNIKHFASLEMSGDSTSFNVDSSSSCSLLRTLTLEGILKKDENKGELSARWNNNNYLAINSHVTSYNSKNTLKIALQSSFKGMESLNFEGSLENAPKRKMAMITYTWGTQVLHFTTSLDTDIKMAEIKMTSPFQGFRKHHLEGRWNQEASSRSYVLSYTKDNDMTILEVKQNGDLKVGDVEITFSSPYEILQQLSVRCSHDFESATKKIDFSASKNNGMPFTFKSKFNYKMNKVNLEMDVECPRHGKTNFEFKGQTKPNLKLKTQIKRNNDFIEVNANLDQPKNERQQVNIKIKSSFEKIRELIFNAYGKYKPWDAESGMSIDLNKDQKYTISSVLSNNELNLDATTPIKGNKALSFKVKFYPEEYSMEMSRDGQLARLSAESRKLRTGRLANLIFASTIQGYEHASIKVSIENQPLKLEFSLQSPYEVIKKVYFNFDLNNNADGYVVVSKLEVPNHMVEIDGTYSNQLKPLRFTLNINAPSTPIKRSEISGQLLYEGLDFTEGLISLKYDSKVHNLNVFLKNQEGISRGKFAVDSSFLYNNKMEYNYNINYHDRKNIMGTVKMETSKSNHKLQFDFKNERNSQQLLVNIECPYLKDGKMSINVACMNEKKKMYKISVTTPRSNPHELSVEFEKTPEAFHSNLSMKCDYLPYKSAAVQGTFYSRRNEHGMAILVETPKNSNTFNAIVKRNAEEMSAEVLVSSPSSSWKSFEISSNLKNKRNELIDGSFKIGRQSKETRLTFNVKRTQWKFLEGFINFNSPYDVLKMGRLDVLYKRSEHDLEGTLDLITSNPNFDKFGLASKIKMSPSRDNIQVMLKAKLPIQHYETIEVTSIYSNKDHQYLPISSRTTLSLPTSRYSVYYTHDPKNSRETIAKIGYEWDNKKVEVLKITKWTADHQSQSHKYIVVTPFKNHEKYESFFGEQYVQGTLKYEVSVKLPRGEEYRLDTAMTRLGPKNIDLKMKIFTPLEGWDMTSGHLRLATESNSQSYFLEISEQSNVYSIRADYIDGNKADIQIQTPHRNWRKIQLLFVIDETNNKNLNAAFRLNDETLFNIDTEENSAGYYNIKMKLPKKEWTALVELQTNSSNKKFAVITTIPGRKVLFITTLQKDNNMTAHGSKFSWEEGKEVSYQVQVVEVSSSKKEYYGTVHFPSRSLEMKTSCFHGDSFLRVKTDFYWDLARHANKHASIEFEHENLSSWKATSHNVRLSLYHYKLSKEISLIARVQGNGEESFGDIDLVYSDAPEGRLELRGRLKKSESQYSLVLSFLQPATHTGVHFTGQLTNTQNSRSLILKTKYTDSQTGVEKSEIRILTEPQNFELMIKRVGFHLIQKFRIISRDLEYGIYGETTYMYHNIAPMHIKYSQRHRSVDIKLPYQIEDPKYLIIEGKLLREALQLIVKRSAKDIADVNIFAGLEDPEHLTGKFRWNQNLLQELNSYMAKKTKEINEVTYRFKRYCVEVQKVFEQNRDFIARRFPEQTVKDIVAEWNAIRKDIEYMSSYVSNMYHHDNLYMKTGAEKLAKSLNAAKPYLQKVVTFHTQLVLNVRDYVGRQLSRYAEAIYNIEINLVDIYDAIYDSLEYCLRSAHNGLSTIIPDVIKYKFYSTVDMAQAYYRGSIEYLASHTLVQAVRHYIERVRSTILEFEWEAAQKEVQATLESTLDVLMGHYDYILNHPAVVYISDVTNAALEKGIYIYRYTGLDDFLSAFSKAVATKIREGFWELFYRVSDEAVTISSKVVYDYSPGFANIRIALLSPRQSLSDFIDISTATEVQRFKNIWNEYIYGDFSIWDMYYMYKRYLDPATWLVPVKSYAMIAGDQHFVTFDGRHYDFKGGCSYLLTHDFLDKNFSAWITFGKQGNRIVKKSITVEVEGREIQLHTDFKVTLDGRRAELPFQLQKTEVIRRGNIIEIDSGRGFSVICNFIHDVCVFELSTFYMGRVGGLLGNPDHEPNLDFLTPNRELASSIDQFAKSWSLADNCPADNKADVTAQDPMADTFCRGLFEAKDSIFRPCYKMVDPAPFMRMCMNDLSNAEHHLQQKKLCISSSAYMSACSLMGVPLRMPGPCVDCGVQDTEEDGPLREGEQFRVYGALSSVLTADVVYLVEEKHCSDPAIRSLPKLALAIDDALVQKGVAANRHASVGFGGSGIHAPPHVHTSEGQLFGTARSVESAFLSLVTGEGPSNAFDAIRFAAALPFRAGAIKTFILVKCSECGGEDSKEDYGEILRTLLDNDIQLHVIMEQDFELKTEARKQKSKKILGLDDTTVYTMNKDMAGDSLLLPHVRMPKDLCVPLAMELQGSLFTSKFLSDPRRSKRLMDAVARRVAKTASTPECQVCECLADQDGVGITSCRSCVSKDFTTSDPSQSKIYQFNSELDLLPEDL